MAVLLVARSSKVELWFIPQCPINERSSAMKDWGVGEWILALMLGAMGVLWLAEFLT
jgi:hypothetical protein